VIAPMTLLSSFAPLKDEHEFATAEVTDFGWTLEWSCGASLDANKVLEMALAQRTLCC
jgi:hypothetical protein